MRVSSRFIISREERKLGNIGVLVMAGLEKIVADLRLCRWFGDDELDTCLVWVDAGVPHVEIRSIVPPQVGCFYPAPTAEEMLEAFRDREDYWQPGVRSSSRRGFCAMAQGVDICHGKHPGNWMRAYDRNAASALLRLYLNVCHNVSDEKIDEQEA